MDDLFAKLPCMRCNGDGRVLFRYGIPNQDRHLPYQEVVWDGAGTWRTCPVCNGSGEGKHKYNGSAGLFVTFDEFGAPHREPLARNRHAKHTEDDSLTD